MERDVDFRMPSYCEIFDVVFENEMVLLNAKKTHGGLMKSAFNFLDSFLSDSVCHWELIGNRFYHLGDEFLASALEGGKDFLTNFVNYHARRVFYFAWLLAVVVSSMAIIGVVGVFFGTVSSLILRRLLNFGASRLFSHYF